MDSLDQVCGEWERGRDRGSEIRPNESSSEFIHGLCDFGKVT